MTDKLTAARAAAFADIKLREGEPAPQWRLIITDSESPTGLAPVCVGERSDALHMIDDYPGGPKRDDEGVYDCCPYPQIETYSTAWAAYLVELLNTDAEVRPAPTFMQPDHTYEHGPWRFHCSAVVLHPDNGKRVALGWTCINDGAWTTFSHPEDEWSEYWTDVTAADDEDRGSIEDVYSATELAEYDRDTEYRLDAEDDARHAEEYDAEQGGA